MLSNLYKVSSWDSQPKKGTSALQQLIPCTVKLHGIYLSIYMYVTAIQQRRLFTTTRENRLVDDVSKWQAKIPN